MRIEQLRKKQILELCKTLVETYPNVLEKEELEIVTNILSSLEEETIQNNEGLLEPIVRKIWDVELMSGNYTTISWNKYADTPTKKPITFATLSKKEDIISFCDCTSGTEYKITYDSIIGACPKDGATLLENNPNSYTVGQVEGKFINSYNGATRLITPIQLVQNGDTGYPSNHNELILDSRFIEEIAPYEIKR